MLKAADLAELEAYRFLLRRDEPVSTVTTGSKLLALLEATCSGDLMDSLTDCERRVLGARGKRNIVTFDENRSSHERFGETWFSGSFAHQHCWHDRMDEIYGRDIEDGELVRRNTQPVPMDLSAMEHSRSKVSRNLR